MHLFLHVFRAGKLVNQLFTMPTLKCIVYFCTGLFLMFVGVSENQLRTPGQCCMVPRECDILWCAAAFPHKHDIIRSILGSEILLPHCSLTRYWRSAKWLHLGVGKDRGFWNIAKQSDKKCLLQWFLEFRRQKNNGYPNQANDIKWYCREPYSNHWFSRDLLFGRFES